MRNDENCECFDQDLQPNVKTLGSLRFFRDEVVKFRACVEILDGMWGSLQENNFHLRNQTLYA